MSTDIVDGADAFAALMNTEAGFPMNEDSVLDNLFANIKFTFGGIKNKIDGLKQETKELSEEVKDLSQKAEAQSQRIDDLWSNITPFYYDDPGYFWFNHFMERV